MSRRIFATVVAALMVFALLPATAAFAQANATAELASGDHVRFPGDHTYTITVHNNEPQLIGRTINAVEIYLPVVGSGVVFNGPPPDQGAWTAYPTKVGSTQYVTYFGGSLAPQASATFEIPATVLRPFRADLKSDFVVKVSSDRFTTSNNAEPEGDEDALSAAVEVLEILGQPVPTAPCDAETNKGVCDNSGTGGYGENALGRPVNGQTVTYAFQVKNHARESLNTTCSLAARDATDEPGGPVTQDIAGEDGVGTCEIPVTLGPAPTGNRTNTFAASAVAPNADAAGKNSPQFTIQRPVDFVFGAFEPARVNSGEGSARQFNVTTQKLGGAAFDLTAGELTFGTNGASLVDAPVAFGTGTRNTTLRYQIAEISGADNDYTARITSIGEDHNLVDYSLDHELGIITIDNLIPTFDLDVPVLGDEGDDVDGDALVAATNDTAITLTGKAFGTAVEGGGHDLENGTLKVWVQPDIGSIVEMNVTQTNESDGVSFTATTPSDYDDWDDNASRFVVSASIEDEAGNIGSDATSFTPVDTDDPVLDEDSAEVVAPNVIKVQFDDATGLRGACHPDNWTVTDPRRDVDHVEAFNDETGQFENCTENEELERTLDPSGVRRLVLASDLSVDDTPDVAYDDGLNGPSTTRLLDRIPAKDGAQNDAPDQLVTAATRLVPPAPDILNPMRLDHETSDREPAYHDSEEDRYFTNVGGADAIRASITGVRDGYLIQVVDADENVVHQEEANNPGPLNQDEPLGNEWTQDITIPLGDADAAYIRGVRLVSAQPSRNAGDITFETFVVDTVLPTVGDGVQTGPTEGLAHFTEKIVTVESDKTAHWRVRWIMEGQNGPEVVRSQPEDVEFIDLTTRRITWASEVQTFEGFDYRLQPGATDARYEDRAGNYMLDTFGSEPIE